MAGAEQGDAVRQAMVTAIPKLRVYAAILLESATEADDLVQDTLVRAWRFRDSFQPGTNFNAWIFRILRNEFIDHVNRRNAVVQDVDGHYAEQIACGPDQEWRLRYNELLRAIPKLPQESREALLLVVGSGLTCAEAAEVCGCAANAMKQRLRRARVRLAELINLDPPDPRRRADSNSDPSNRRGRADVQTPGASSETAGRSQTALRASAAAFGSVAVAVGVAAAPQALAAPPTAPASSAQFERIEAQLAEQARRLAEQDRKLAEQAAELRAQQIQLNALQAERDRMLASLRGAGLGGATEPETRMAAASQAPKPAPETALPTRPVGEAPKEPEPARQVAAIPTNVGVLTPPGQLLVDPSIEYVRTSNNRLVFRGVEIVPGVQLGVIEASDVQRDTAVATIAARYGLTSRLEVEARIPYVYRHDQLSLVAQADPPPGFEASRDDENHGVGDIEFAARYQINQGRNGWPIFVANARVKPPTGTGPFDVDYDEFGIAEDPATGSGFWGVEGGVTMLYPTDPAIIFAGLSYLSNLPRDINKVIGPTLVGRVDPGDAIGLQAGFGLSLNPRFSVSFGYSHNYIFPTKSELGGTNQESRALQVGTLQMGWSFRLAERLTLNNSFEFGVTSDAPDLRLVIRAPYRF